MFVSTTAAFRLASRQVASRSSLPLAISARFSSTAVASNNNMDDMTPDSLFESFESSSMIGNDIKTAMYSLYKADAVCFDVDSTVIAEEGIDVLAEYLGKGEEVSALTKQAMEGGMKFQDALATRLSLLQPSKASIQQLLKEQPLMLTPGVDKLMKTLQAKNVDIWLVSGGFRIMIEPVAKQLNIPTTNIVANTLYFDDSSSEGKYIGFDIEEPTSADMGKPKALQQLQASQGYQTMVMVGDGATDAQAKPPAKAFIGFGGIVERQAVKDKADWFVTDFEDMVRIVEQRD